MHINRWSVGLTGAFALSLGMGAIACGNVDPPVSPDEERSDTDTSPLTRNVAVGAILIVTDRTTLRDDPYDGDAIRRLQVGEKLIALEAAPENGYYHVKTVVDGLDGYARGRALKLPAPVDAGVPSTTDAGGIADAATGTGDAATGTADAGPQQGRVYPRHTNIVSTTFWVGELFNASLADGSQVCSTYDSNWAFHWSGVNKGTVPASAEGCAGSIYGGCDGRISGDACLTEPRTAANGYFPSQGTPKENPFYLDLPFDDLNDATAFAQRCTVIPWANDPGYAGHCKDAAFSYMKNRWVRIVGPNGKTCYGQNEDAGPSHGSLYHDAAYVFGTNDAQPIQGQFNNAGMDVSPALNGCLGFKELDGESDKISWQFVDAVDVPAGPWKTIVTTSQVSN
jgi:hypothetical protein